MASDDDNDEEWEDYGPFCEEEYRSIVEAFKHHSTDGGTHAHIHDLEALFTMEADPTFARRLLRAFKGASTEAQATDTISFAEFFAGVSGCSRASDRSILRTLFRVVDADSTGVIPATQVSDFFFLAYHLARESLAVCPLPPSSTSSSCSAIAGKKRDASETFRREVYRSAYRRVKGQDYSAQLQADTPLIRWATVVDDEHMAHVMEIARRAEREGGRQDEVEPGDERDVASIQRAPGGGGDDVKERGDGAGGGGGDSVKERGAGGGGGDDIRERGGSGGGDDRGGRRTYATRDDRHTTRTGHSHSPPHTDAHTPHTPTHTPHTAVCDDEGVCVGFEDFYAWASEAVPLLHSCFGRFVYTRVCASQPDDIPPQLKLDMPRLCGGSAIFQHTDQVFGLAVAAAACQGVWKRLYSSRDDGLTWPQLCLHVLNYNGPTVLVLRDHQGALFGYFTSEGWKDRTDFYGSHDCFLFRVEPQFSIYRPKFNTDAHFMYFNTARGHVLPRGLGIGSNNGDSFRVFIPPTFEQCVAQPSCTTFESGHLASKQFELEALEVWAVGGEEVIDSAMAAHAVHKEAAADRRARAAKVDKSRFVDSGFDREMLLGRTFAHATQS